MARIANRGRSFEADMDPEYISELARLYNDFFFNYQDTPLLVIQTEGFNFADSDDDVDQVVRTIDDMPGGTQYLVAARDLDGEGQLGSAG